MLLSECSKEVLLGWMMLARRDVEQLDGKLTFADLLLYAMQWCFRAGNRASGPDFGRILVVSASKSALRPAFGWPEVRV